MTHEQVRQLVRRINPIPDPTALATIDVPVPALERSRDMQVDDRPLAKESRGNRWRGPLIGIAAAMAVVVGAVIVFNTGGDDVAAPAPNAMELPGEDQPLGPGAYFAETDSVDETTTRATFVIEGSGWVSIDKAGSLKEGPGGSVDGGSYVSLLFGELDQVWEAPCTGGTSEPAGKTAKALGDQFAAMPGFTIREGLTQVSAFGHDGYHLVLQVPVDCTASDRYYVWASKNWGERYYQVEGQVVEYWFLDVEGTTVMVEATRPPESGEEMVSELNADLDTVLNSLVITP